MATGTIQTNLAGAAPVTPGSAGLAELIAAVGEGAAERERTEERPFAAIDLVRRARFGAFRLPVEQGGGGATVRELFETLIALAAADSNVAHILRAHFSFVEERLRAHDPAVRARWLPAVAGGALVGVALTEISSHPVASFRWNTTLVPRGDGWVLNGEKYFSTGTLYSDYVEVFAGTPAGETATVVIPVDRDGVTLVDDWDGFGQRMTGTGTTIFRDVLVEAGEATVFPLPAEGEAPPPLYLLGAFLQLWITAIIAGILRETVDDAAGHIHSRRRTFAWAPADTPAADPLLQHVVGQIASNAFAAEATVLAAADVLQQATEAALAGDPDPAPAHAASLAASKAKVVVDELGTRTTSLLFEVGGASAARRAHNLDRHWRNARTLASHNPTVYKAQLVGAYHVNGTPLPGSGYF
jgi:alkylation response protein AidB-like acyl-CoA dehydrogenase